MKHRVFIAINLPEKIKKILIDFQINKKDYNNNHIILWVTTIKEIKTRGMNDIEMLRDLVYSGIQVYSNYYNVDYYGGARPHDKARPKNSRQWERMVDYMVR
jgi:hypothetical protein